MSIHLRPWFKAPTARPARHQPAIPSVRSRPVRPGPERPPGPVSLIRVDPCPSVVQDQPDRTVWPRPASPPGPPQGRAGVVPDPFRSVVQNDIPRTRPGVARRTGEFDGPGHPFRAQADDPCPALDSAGRSGQNDGMEVQGRIHNGVVVLEGDLPLPEGTRVTVTYPVGADDGITRGRSARPIAARPIRPAGEPPAHGGARRRHPFLDGIREIPGQAARRIEIEGRPR